MRRIPLHGIAKQLLIAGSGPLMQDCLPLACTAASALRLLMQQCWLHSPAGSQVASSAHSYHGSRDDEEGDKKDATAKVPGKEKSKEAEGAVMRQMEAIQEAIQQAVQEGRSSIRDPGHVPEHVARHFMRDPLGMILSSQGVPMGISLKVDPQKLPQHRRREVEADRQDWRELLNQVDSRPSSSAQDQGTEVPRTEAQLLKAKCAEAADKLISDAQRVRFRQQWEEEQQQQGQQQQGQQQQQSQSEERPSSSVADDSSSSRSKTLLQHGSPVGQQVKEQLAALLSAVDKDSWGTTRQSPAEIAQHIADSNRRAGVGSGGGDGSHDNDEDGSDDEPLELSATEERYIDQSAVVAELKEMDEIFEVLAKVPWLDDDDVDERELRGVVAVGLLGTLEEVGWQLRAPLLSLWAGERDLDKLTADVGPRESSALTAIMYHTQQLEEQFNKPPAAGVAAALAAARGPASGAGSTPNTSDADCKVESK